MPNGTTIVMELPHNNKDILNITLDELSEEDRTIINKAMEEFKEKCLLSYARMHDNIIQKTATEGSGSWVVRHRAI
jgi:hypothetical protein